MDWIVSLLTLSVMEIVLGIDNVIFIAILVMKLPQDQQVRARRIGIGLALAMRIGLLFTLNYVVTELTGALFSLTDLGLPAAWFAAEDATAAAVERAAEMNAISARDLILLAGGLFLIGKSVFEIHDKLEGAAEKPVVKAASKFHAILVQILILDLVFSLDSVITAVGMAKEIWVMVAAMSIACGVMLVFSGPISAFVHRHPTLKILALSFLILIGVMLVVEGAGQHIDKGYIYFAMAFAFLVEMLNLRLRKAAPAVELHEPPPVTA